MKIGEIWKRTGDNKYILGIPVCDEIRIINIKYADWCRDYRIQFIHVGEGAFEGTTEWLGREKFLVCFKHLCDISEKYEKL